MQTTNQLHGAIGAFVLVFELFAICFLQVTQMPEARQGNKVRSKSDPVNNCQHTEGHFRKINQREDSD